MRLALLRSRLNSEIILSNLFSWFGKKGSGKTPERALAALKEADDAAESDARASTKLFEEAIGIYQSLGLRREEALAHYAHARMLVNDSSYTAAFEAFEASIAILKSLALRAEMAAVLRDCGLASAAYSNFEQAEEQLQQSLKLYDALGDRAGACSCVEGLGNAAVQDEQYETARDYYDRALALRTELAQNPEASVCLVYLSSIAVTLGDFQTAQKWYADSIERYRADYPDSQLLGPLTDLGRLPFDAEDEGQVIELLNAAVTIYAAGCQDRTSTKGPLSRTSAAEEKKPETSAVDNYVPTETDPTDWHSQASAYLILGAVAYSQELPPKARDLFDQAATLARQNADNEMLRHGLYQAGACAYRHLDLTASRRWFTELAGPATSDSNNPYEAIALDGVARAAYLQRDIAAARTACEQSLELFKSDKSIKNVSRSLELYGLILSEDGDRDTAIKMLKESEALCRRLDDPYGALCARQSLGSLLIGVDESHARACLEECIASNHSDAKLSNLAVRSLAELELHAGELATAYELGCRSLTASVEQGDAIGVAVSLDLCAHIAVEWGDIEAAVVLLAKSTGIRDLVGTPRSSKVQARFEANVAALKAELNSEEFDRAWSEGRDLSLEDTVDEASALLEDIEPEEDDAPDDAEDFGAIV